MKILYYSPHPFLNLMNPSGYATHIRETITAFQSLGHEVLPVIMGGMELPSGNTGSKSDRLKEAAKKMVPSFFWESLKDYILLKKDDEFHKLLLKEIKKFQPELIYERGNYLQLSGTLAAKQSGIRHILEINAPYVEERKILQGSSAFTQKATEIEKKQLSLADKIIVVSSVLKEYFIKKHGSQPEKIIFIPNAINPEKVKVDERLVARLREQFHFGNETIIGFVGSIFPWHGVDILIRAFAALARETKNIRLLIVGDGEVLPSLKELTKESGIADRINFTGNVPHEEVYNYIAVMDIAVMPKSNWYGSPVKIFEYGALKKAIIAPDVAPVRDVMVHGTDGLLIPPSPDALAGVLKTLITDEKTRTSLGNNFHLKVMSKHTWKQNAQKILEA